MSTPREGEDPEALPSDDSGVRPGGHHAQAVRNWYFEKPTGLWRAIFAHFLVAIKAPRSLGALLKALLLPEERFGACWHGFLTEITRPRRSAEISISSTGC